MDHIMKSQQQLFAPNGTLVTRIKSQKIDSGGSKSSSTFYRNLEDALDVRRASKSLRSIVQNNWQTGDAVGFCSNDLLSFNATGVLRAEFLAELAQRVDFNPGSGGARLLDGDYPYLKQFEQEASAFHGFEAGLVFGSGYDANIAIWTALPRSGDVILYDELVHTSIHDGIDQSVAAQKFEFRHNSPESFQETLELIFSSQPQIREGRRSVLVAVESIYGMDGDVCPLRELIDVAKNLTSEQHGNIQFVVDEAHSTGLIGPNGAGFVCELNLEEEVAVVMHSFAKAVGSIGGELAIMLFNSYDEIGANRHANPAAIVVGNKTIVDMVVNFARCFIFTTSPPLPFVATVRAGYKLLKSPQGVQCRLQVQTLAQLFFETLTSHEEWESAQSKGLLSVPLADGWEERPFQTHVITIHTRPRYTFWLYFHLLLSSYCTLPVEHPLVPVGQSRIKVTIHAINTEQEVEGLVASIYEWLEEVMEVEDEATEARVTKAAAIVYQWMRREGLEGFGLV